MSLSFSKRWAGYLAAKTGQSPENEAVLAYVIEVLATNVINTAIILLLGLLFNVLPCIISCLVTITFLRFTAGGAHSNSPWRCATVTALVFLAMSIIASRLALMDRLYTDILAVLAIVTGLILVIRLAPVDSPSAPIISASRRKRLKKLSLLVISLIATAIILLRQSTWIYAREIQAAMVLCVLWSSFNLSKPGHRLMSFIDGKHISKLKNKEVH